MGQKYSCDTTTYTCVKKSDGTYPAGDCIRQCVRPPPAASTAATQPAINVQYVEQQPIVGIDPYYYDPYYYPYYGSSYSAPFYYNGHYRHRGGAPFHGGGRRGGFHGGGRGGFHGGGGHGGHR